MEPSREVQEKRPPKSKFEHYDFDQTPNMQDYLDKRFYPQLEWYEKHAKFSRYEFYLCQAVIVIVIALISIIKVSAVSDYVVKVLSSVFGGIIIVATGVFN